MAKQSTYSCDICGVLTRERFARLRLEPVDEGKRNMDLCGVCWERLDRHIEIAAEKGIFPISTRGGGSDAG